MGNSVRFESGKRYRVIKDLDSGVDRDLRMASIRDTLHVDEVLRFRGPNLGFAQFIDDTGRTVFLSRKEAFTIFDTTPVTSYQDTGK